MILVAVPGFHTTNRCKNASYGAVMTYDISLLTMRSRLSQPEFELIFCPLTGRTLWLTGIAAERAARKR